MAQPERILCVPTAAVRARGVDPGYNDRAEGRRTWAVLAPWAAPRDRTPELESDPDWTQLVVYGVVRLGAAVLGYRRGDGDGRLLGRWSLGVGGHVNADDLGADGRRLLDVPRRALLRELAEELELAGTPTLRAAGTVYDPAEPTIGRYHLGLVYEVTVDDAAVQVRETPPEGVVWFRPEHLAAADRWPWESWSELIRARLATPAP